MSDCYENGTDMTQRVFFNSIKFLHKIEPAGILISGGEPTLYPDIIHIIRRLQLEFPNTAFVLCTNGTFTEIDCIAEQLPGLNIVVQITHDARYYPKPIDLKKLRDYDIELKLQTVCQYGRAAKNGISLNDRSSPYCFNMRSILKHTDFITANKNREGSFKFCSWGITPQGKITLSESLLCPTVGSVTDPIEVIEDNIRHFKCTDCVYARRMMSYPKFAAVLT